MREVVIFIRDEHKPRFGLQVLTLWSGHFSSDYEGDAFELPNHNGYTVTIDGETLLVTCPAPRTEQNYILVDEAINEAIRKCKHE